VLKIYNKNIGLVGEVALMITPLKGIATRFVTEANTFLGYNLPYSWELSKDTN